MSRLAANIQLMIFICGPLSFIEVGRNADADAMLGVHELRDMALAAGLFAWIYRRACARYPAVLQAVAAPDPEHNCARYRLSTTAVHSWIAAGRRAG